MRKKQSPTPDPSPSTHHPSLIAAAVAVLAVTAYVPALGNGFVNYDDPLYVTENPHVLGGPTPDNLAWAWATGHAANWHPLTWHSLQLDAALVGADPVGYHLTNVLLHAANSALVFLTLRRLTGAAGRSAAVAVLFALHPLHVESVAWVSERKDVLSGLFWLLTTLAYARYAEAPSAGRMAAVVALFAAGLTAKPMLVTLPFALLLLDYWPLARLRGWADVWPRVREKLPLFALTAAACAVTVVVQSRAGAVADLQATTPYERLTGVPVGYVVYLGMTAYPADLCVLYPHPVEPRPGWQPAAAVVLLLGVTAAAVRLRRSAPYFVVGWLWFLGTLVPVIGLVQVGSQAYADRYTYLPHVGLFAAVVWGVADLAARSRLPAAVPAGLAVAAAVGCLVVTWHQILFWADSQTLWNRALAVTPTNPTAHYNLGTELIHARRWAEAADHLAVAAKYQPRKFDTRANRAYALYEINRVAEAEAEAVAALAVAPDRPESIAALLFVTAEASARRGNVPEAEARYAASLQAADTLLSRLGYGRLLLRTGRPAEAVIQLKAARVLAPDHPEAAAELAAAERAAR